MTRSAAMTVAEFNRADDQVAAESLGACLDIEEWVAAVAAGRPYPDLAALLAAGSAASAKITWDQVAGALRRHPRIGEKRAAAEGTATEASWSASEQSGVRDTQADSLAAGNLAYEQKFGFLFLICAAGLSGEQILRSLHTRLGNDIDDERPVVVDELRKIAALRLARSVSS